ncbi:MAG: SGNH/GDSL hydrolase family protein [Bacteroidaceae bacterium]|nr:SGNH/GDSL hydrolase family protein [Bacteroidaceae bacterium]
MKRFLISMFALAASLATTSLSAQPAQDWANFGRYQKANAEVKQLPQDQRKVVFIGNSITDNWASRHGQFFKDNGYVGRGIGGQTTYQMVLRFYEDVVNLHPKAVVINGGTNDIALNNHPYVEDRTFQNITIMAQIAKQNKIKVILTSITPCDHYVWRPEVTDVVAKIKSLNARIQAYAKQNKFQYVDYFSAMADANGVMRDGISDEGCHPNVAGYEIMEPLVQAAIHKVVKK